MKLKVFMGQSLGMVPFGSYSKFAGKLWMFNDVHPPNYGIMSFNPSTRNTWHNIPSDGTVSPAGCSCSESTQRIDLNRIFQHCLERRKGHSPETLLCVFFLMELFLKKSRSPLPPSPLIAQKLSPVGPPGLSLQLDVELPSPSPASFPVTFLSRGSHLFGQLWQPGTILAIFFCIFIGSFMIGIRAVGSGSVQIGVSLGRSGWDVMVGVGQLVCDSGELL